jgi:CBS domain-containing membrane protein
MATRTAPQPTALEELRAEDVMSTILLTVGPDESVLMAYELMSRAGVHHVPVVTSSGRCLGLLDAPTLMQEWYPAPLSRQRRPVRALLRNRTPSVEPKDSLRFVAEQLDINEVDALPVVDAHGRLLGLVTSRDVVAAVAGRRHRQPAGDTVSPVLFTMTPVVAEPAEAEEEQPPHPVPNGT